MVIGCFPTLLWVHEDRKITKFRDFCPKCFFFLKKIQNLSSKSWKNVKKYFLSFFLWVFKKSWKIIFLWFFRLKRHKNVFGRPISSTWVVLVRCGPLWRTGNVDIFAFKIESKYVSRSVTKVFVGYLYVLNTIFIILKSQNWFLWRFRASKDWLVKVAWLVERVLLDSLPWRTENRDSLFRTWSQDIFVGLSPNYSWSFWET